MIFKKLWSRRVIIPLIGLAIVLAVARTSNPSNNAQRGISVDYTPYNEPYRVSLTGYTANTLAKLDLSPPKPINLVHDRQGKLTLSYQNRIYTLDPSSKTGLVPLEYYADKSYYGDNFDPGFLSYLPDKTLFILTDFIALRNRFGSWKYLRIEADSTLKELDVNINYQIERFDSESQLATDSHGNMYISHPNYGEIWRITPEGDASYWVTLPSQRIREKSPYYHVWELKETPSPSRPTTLAFDPTTNTINVYDASSQYIYAIPIRPDGTPDVPTITADMYDHRVAVMTFDNEGRLVWAEDRGNDSGLWRIETDGKYNLLLRGLDTPISMTATDQGIYLLVRATDPKNGKVTGAIKAITLTGTATKVPTDCVGIEANGDGRYGRFIDIDHPEYYWLHPQNSELDRVPILANAAFITKYLDGGIHFRPSQQVSSTNDGQLGDLIWYDRSDIENYRRVRVLEYNILLSRAKPNMTTTDDFANLAFLTQYSGSTYLNILESKTNQRRRMPIASPSIVLGWADDLILTATLDNNNRIEKFVSYDTKTLTERLTWKPTGTIEQIAHPEHDPYDCPLCFYGLLSAGTRRLSYVERSTEGKRTLVAMDFVTGKALKTGLPEFTAGLDSSSSAYYFGPKHIIILEDPSSSRRWDLDKPGQITVPTLYLFDLEHNKLYSPKGTLLQFSTDENSVYIHNPETCTVQRLDFPTSKLTTIKEHVIPYKSGDFSRSYFMLAQIDGDCHAEKAMISNLFILNLKTNTLITLTDGVEKIDPERGCDTCDNFYSHHRIWITSTSFIVAEPDFSKIHRFPLPTGFSAKQYAHTNTGYTQKDWLVYGISNGQPGDYFEFFALDYATGKIENLSRNIGPSSLRKNANTKILGYYIEPADTLKSLVLARMFQENHSQVVEIGLYDHLTRKYSVLTSSFHVPNVSWSRDDQYFAVQAPGDSNFTKFSIYRSDGTLMSTSTLIGNIEDSSSYWGACPR